MGVYLNHDISLGFPIGSVGSVGHQKKLSAGCSGGPERKREFPLRVIGIGVARSLGTYPEEHKYPPPPIPEVNPPPALLII